jgi:galactokinase
VFFVTPLQDVNTAKDEMEETTYRRAKHVVTENFQRVQECKVPGGVFGTTLSKTLLAISEFEGFEVSCEELDVLVDIAQAHEGVYGSRLTGGGFGEMHRYLG